MGKKNENGLTALYDRHADTVYRVCLLYMKQREDAEDMVQSTFLKLLERPVDFKDEEHERAWLIVSASNGCKNHLKHWFRIRRSSMPLEACGKETGEDAREVLQELMNLPGKYATLLYLYYYEGYNTREIAVMQGDRESTVRSRLVKARTLLGERLRRESHG